MKGTRVNVNQKYFLFFMRKKLMKNIFCSLFYRKNDRPLFHEMDILFAARGLLSFIAFTEFTASLRCLLPYEVYEGGENQDPKSFIQARLFNKVHLNFEAERVLCHTYGLFCAICEYCFDEFFF